MIRSARRLSLLLTVAAACRSPAVPPTLALTHVAVVDVERGTLLPDRTVLVYGRRIGRVDSALPVPASPDYQTIDGTGLFLIPGLWDMHVHMDDAHTAGQLVSWGITGARVMSGGLEETLALREGVLAGRVRGPRLLVVGLALHGRASFAPDTGLALVQSGDEGRRAVDSLARRGVDFIKVHEGLSREAWFAIARAARGHGIPLTGHVAASLTPEEASDSGLGSIEHLEFLPDACLVLFNSSTHRLVPPGCQPPALERLLQHLHRNSVWLDPTIGSFRAFAPRQFPDILAGFAALVPLIRETGLPVLAGTDFGSAGITPGASLHDEMALLVDAGFSPAEALRAATRNPAVFLGVGDSLGKADSGDVADFVLLQGNPLSDIHNTKRIAAVVQGGILIPRVVLDSLRR
ncbi:MAG TPA: amidohydrolase family protein [Gemmatimonadales bacterium]|nr:amidohydrolase family protein [Gemmatimonadales bacterium]